MSNITCTVIIAFTTSPSPRPAPFPSPALNPGQAKTWSWAPPKLVGPIRVACLHGTCSNGNITKAPVTTRYTTVPKVSKVSMCQL